MKLPELTPWWLIRLSVRGEIVGGAVMPSPEIGRFPDEEALKFTEVKDPDLQVDGWMLDDHELISVGKRERALTKEELVSLGRRIFIKNIERVP